MGHEVTQASCTCSRVACFIHAAHYGVICVSLNGLGPRPDGHGAGGCATVKDPPADSNQGRVKSDHAMKAWVAVALSLFAAVAGAQHPMQARRHLEEDPFANRAEPVDLGAYQLQGAAAQRCGRSPPVRHAVLMCP